MRARNQTIEHSIEHSFLAPRQIQAIRNFDCKSYADLSRIGINIPEHRLQQMMNSPTLLADLKNVMDAIQPTVTTGSMATPVQFLQAWLPGFVYVLTGARKIDSLVGLSTIGSWHDEEVVQGVLERTGTSVPYGDTTNIPLSSWNVNFDRRTFVRFEEGMMVGRLEELRAAEMRVDSGSMKREAAALALEIIRNYVGFYGFNSGANRTYGFLNDPSLPAYIAVANGATGFPQWSTKTFLEIQRDILSAIVSLRTNSQDVIDPAEVDITLAVATAAVDQMNRTGEFGLSVTAWLNKSYPRVRVVSAPQLNAANGGANVFYLYAEKVNDGSSDDGRTFIQPVASKFMVVGIQQLVKSYVEDFSNATAGIMCKRPYAVVRRSGI